MTSLEAGADAAGGPMPPDGGQSPMPAAGGQGAVPPDGPATSGGLTGTGSLSCLATTDAEALIARSARVTALLPQILAALAGQTADAPGRLFDITAYPAEQVDLIGQMLGEGEVSATVAMPDGIMAEIVESVFAGLWRVRFSDRAGTPLADYLEVGAIPEAVRRAAAATPADLTVGPPPAGVMNALPVLAEIRAAMAAYRPGDPARVMTLSLLPMTPADVAFLQQTLGNGPVAMASRGYGTCRVLATGARHVWSVQFFNSQDTLILDKLEIGGVPAAACAADEDFQDSAERLKDIIAAYFA